MREKKEVARACFAKAMGSSGPRRAERLTLPGPDQLTLDGKTRKVVFNYDKDFVAELFKTHRLL